MNHARRLCAYLLLTLLLAACGQSGPLYLPGNPSQVQNPPSQTSETAPSEEERDDRQDDDES